MLGYPEFHHDLIEKYVSVFGSLFTGIELYREGSTSNTKERIKVPLTFASRDKVLAFAAQQFKSDQMSVATVTPRISFDMSNIVFAPQRKLNKFQQICLGDNQLRKAVPYDLHFEVSILTKTEIEATRIVEQIIPFFDPSITVTIKPFPAYPDFTRDVIVSLNEIQKDDSYQGQDERRMVIWSLGFTLQGHFYGPITSDAAIVKLVKVNTLWDNEILVHETEVFPGLDSNGNPTTDENEAIPYLDVQKDDPYAIIVRYGV